MSEPTTVNQDAVIVNSIVKAAIEKIADPLIESAFFADFPWLDLPVIRDIFIYLIGFAGNYFYRYTAQTATALVISLQTAGQASIASKAIDTLRKAIAINDAAAIQSATDAFNAAMADLVHYNGSAPV